MSANSSKSLLQLVRGFDVIIECPICSDRLPENIRQCITGHHACIKCATELRLCPLCSHPFTARNYLAERMITKFDEIKNLVTSMNEKKTTTPTPMPAVIVPDKIPCGMEKCIKTLSYKDMIIHMKKDHSEDFEDEGPSSDNKYTDYLLVERKKNTWWEKIIYIKNMGIFFIKFHINKKGKVYGFVTSANKNLNEVQYYYRLRVNDQENDYLCFEGTVSSTVVEHKKGDYISVDGAAVVEGCFDVYVKITQKQ